MTGLRLPRWYRERVEPVPDDEDLRVSTLELFFDLVFVFTVTQLTHVVSHDYRTGFPQTFLMFGVIWWIYAGYAWLTNAVPPRRPARRILLLVAMAGWLIVAMAVPDAFGGTGVWFSVGMLIVVLVHGAMYLQSTRAFVPVFIANVTGVGLTFGADFTHGALKYALWLAAVAIMWLSPVIAGQAGFRLHAGHISERHGLVVIITIGESVVAVGAAAGGAHLSARLVLIGVLGLCLAACLWWAYFTRDLERAEETLAGCADTAVRTGKILWGFFFWHVPILLGIVAIAAAMGSAIAHAEAPLGPGPRWALSAGLTAFLVGSMLFRRVMNLHHGWTRAAAAVAAPCTVPLGQIAAAWQLSALVAILLAMLIAEDVGTSRRRDQVVTFE